ncbi:4-diphosphocytidyl-2-C-methyl-D-erythritol kinase [hydrothermal vent metagenome]|uniref:4-(cytidine 5'-diphospho)-2-C-methyl-D-erythritol kinase n=1 Tax=hydrothermal vent metagenome TaxID=652676 RepID=A0A3B0VLP0_9ZZZZ
MRIKAPAKINLSLRVTSKREDGFHEIITLMQPLSLSDLITVTVNNGAGITITCDDPDIPTDGRNLAYKAALMFLEEAGLARKVHIDMGKRIPVAAGLGGGSSDGAATLQALNELTGAPLTEAQLHAIAAGLGSDVPFFLLRGSAVAGGRGELLRPVKLPGYSYILINPGFGVSAAWAYGNLTLTETSHNIRITDLEESAVALLERPSSVVDILENDLERAVAAQRPEVSELLLALKESGAAGALMSGSGPTVFGLFLSESGAAPALEALEERFKGYDYRIIAAKGL